MEDTGDRTDLVAVLLTLPFGENRPAHQVGVDLKVIIAFFPVRPALGNVRANPALMLQLGEEFDLLVLEREPGSGFRSRLRGHEGADRLQLGADVGSLVDVGPAEVLTQPLPRDHRRIRRRRSALGCFRVHVGLVDGAGELLSEIVRPDR